MKRSILIQQIYPDTPGVKLLEMTRNHHEAYCKRHGLDYRCVIDNPSTIPPEAGSWGKIQLIKDALADGYDSVIWLDADTLIVDMDTPLTKGVVAGKIGVCWHRIPQGDHWNVGTIYLDNTEETRAFIDAWLASYPPEYDGWMEQGVFNKMAQKSKTVVTISDRWNATLAVSMVPDAVVLGFHGQGDTKYRADLMKRTMDKLFPNQKADAAQGEREVKDDG
jgi:hypothetical protein